MKKVQSIEGLMIMELTQRDNAYDPNLTQYIVVDRDRNEVGTGPAGLEESVVFAKGYYSDYLATFSVHGSMNVRASNEKDAREKARNMTDAQIVRWVRESLQGCDAYDVHEVSQQEA